MPAHEDRLAVRYTAGDFLQDARARLPELTGGLGELEREPTVVLADLVAYEVVTAATEAAGGSDHPFAGRAFGFLDEVAADPRTDPDVLLAVQTARRHVW